jgi:hypothetical protein
MPQVMELKSASLSPAASKERLASSGFDDEGSISVSSRTSKRRAKDLVSKYTKSNSLKDDKDSKQEAPEQRELELGTSTNETIQVQDEAVVREEVPVTEESEFTNDIITKIDSWTSTISRKILSKNVSFSKNDEVFAAVEPSIVPSISKDGTEASKANSKAESTANSKSEKMTDNIASDAEKVVLSLSNGQEKEQEQESLCSKTSQSVKSKLSSRSVKSSKVSLAEETEIDDQKSVTSKSSLKNRLPEDTESVVTSRFPKFSLKKSRDTHESNHMKSGSKVEKGDENSLKAASAASFGEKQSVDMPAIDNESLVESKAGKSDIIVEDVELAAIGSRSIGKSVDGKDAIGIKDDEASTTGKSTSSRSAKQDTRSATGSVVSKVPVPSDSGDEESEAMLSSATSRSGKKSGQRIVASSRSVASKTPSVKEKEIGARGDEIVNNANKSGSQDSTDTAQTADSMAASTCSTCHTGMRFICSWFG